MGLNCHKLAQQMNYFPKLIKISVFAWLLLATLSGYAQGKNNKYFPVTLDQESEMMDTTVFYGKYNGHDIEIKSENSKDGCIIKKMWVDGINTWDEIRSPDILINGKDEKYSKKGDKVIIRIIHRKGCNFICSNEAIKKKIKK